MLSYKAPYTHWNIPCGPSYRVICLYGQVIFYTFEEIDITVYQLSLSSLHMFIHYYTWIPKPLYSPLLFV